MTLHIQTPLFESMAMSRASGKSVLLKMECFQPSGSFKIRGIGRLCEEFVNAGKSHLISSSGGNAGYAVAYAGRRLGVEVTVVVPETTPAEVRQRIRLEGASVEVQGAVWDETHQYALELVEQKNGAYVPPFDHPTIWTGHATIVDELSQQCPQPPDVIILSVGGGGLLCGVVAGLQRNHWADVPIIAVETEGADSLAASIKAGRLVSLDRISSVATTLGAKQVAAKAFEYTRSHPILSATVPDSAALEACFRFSDDHRILVEPACGATLSLAYDNADLIKAARSVLLIVCGGIGATIRKLVEWRENYRTSS